MPQYECSWKASTDGLRRLSIVGELDLEACPQLNAMLDEAVQERSGEVVADLSGVTFIDSTALRSFVRTHNELSGVGGRLTIVDPSPAVARVLELAGLSGLLAVDQPGFRGSSVG
jgi:anti-sigma B factor antagonist